MMMHPIILAIVAKLALLAPILIGGLALLAAKAAIIAKIALVLSLILGAGSLFGGGGISGLGGKDLFSKFGGGSNGWTNLGNYGGGGYSSYVGSSYSPAWNTVAQGGPYARSGESAQDVAYSAQKP